MIDYKRIETKMTKKKVKGCGKVLYPRVQDTDCGDACRFCGINHYCDKCRDKFVKSKRGEKNE